MTGSEAHQLTTVEQGAAPERTNLVCSDAKVISIQLAQSLP
jgi:hypothetical protein